MHERTERAKGIGSECHEFLLNVRRIAGRDDEATNAPSHVAGRTLLVLCVLAPFVVACSGHETRHRESGGTGAVAVTAGNGGRQNGGAAGSSDRASGATGGLEVPSTGGMGSGGTSSFGGEGDAGLSMGGASQVAGTGGGGAANGGAAGSGAGEGAEAGAGNGGGAGTPGFSWRALPSLAKKRQNAMGVAVGTSIYVLGGFDESGLLDEVERLGWGDTEWTMAPSLPNPQCCAAAGLLGTFIAIAGGYESDGHTPTDALLLFDTTTGAWQSGPPMPTARANAMAAVWNGKLVVIGGGTQYGATQATGVIESYDPTSNSWSTSPLAVTPRAAGVAVADSDRVYVVGGAIQNSLYGDALVEILTADGVTPGPSLGLARVQVAGGLLPAGLVVAGGWTDSLETNAAEGLFGTRATWQSLPPMPTARAGAAAAVVNGNLIVAGGGQFHGQWVQLDAVEALEAD